jgi:pimeloyl-ACP methyl ester carboxylesterase
VALYHEIAGSGSPVVLVHEGIADSRMWDAQWEAFTARHHTLRLDLPGFGRSELAGPLVAPGADVAALLDSLSIERAALVGASFGGRIALEVALARPELVGALVLVGAGHPAHDWSEAMEANDAAEAEAVARGDIDAAVELSLRTWIDGPHRAPHEVDAGVRAAVGAMARRAYELQAPLWDELDLEPLEPELANRIPEVDVPTLVVVGALDVDDIQATGRRLAAEIPGARHAVVESTAHAPMMERPAEFNELVLGFLAEVLAPP